MAAADELKTEFGGYQRSTDFVDRDRLSSDNLSAVDSIKIFISYADTDTDNDLKNELRKSLAALEADQKVTLWDRGDLLGGQRSEDVVREKLEQSQIVLLLISSDFMADDGLCKFEMNMAMEKLKHEIVRVVPIPLRTVFISDSNPLKKLAWVPSGDRWVTLSDNKDAAFTEIAEGIVRICDDIRTKDRRSQAKEPTIVIDWLEKSRNLLASKKMLTTNSAQFGAARNIDDVHVPLGLKRKEDIKFIPQASPDHDKYKYIETRFDHKDFLAEVISKRDEEKRIAIIGEPGAGKTTLLVKVGEWLIANSAEPLIVVWVSLSSVGEQTLEKYLEEEWLQEVADTKEKQKIAWKSLQEMRSAGRVWLLLDGLDEMSNNSLQWVKNSLDKAWMQSVRVVMTCRLNLWDNGWNQIAERFQIYQTLEYDYQPLDQVMQFMNGWFDNDSSVVEPLREALEEPGKEYIKDLVRNPLRLTLFCASVEKNLDLPDTQSQLYKKFIDYLYVSQSAKFEAEVKKKVRLNKALGELAKLGLNRIEGKQLQFTSNEMEKLWADDESTSGALKKLGFLKCVEKTQQIYSFLHLTFQEYFAACSIDSSDYFLPEIPADVSIDQKAECIYRVFEAQWQQVILLWFGRADISATLKNNFLFNLTNFEKKEEGFYYYRAYSLSLLCISEFKIAEQKSILINQFLEWVADSGRKNERHIIPQDMSQLMTGLEYKVDVSHFALDLLMDIDSEIREFRIKNVEYRESIKLTKSLELVRKIQETQEIIESFNDRRINVLEALRSYCEISIKSREYLWEIVYNAPKEDNFIADLAFVIVKEYAMIKKDSTAIKQIEDFKNSDRYGIILSNRLTSRNTIHPHNQVSKDKEKSSPEFKNDINRNIELFNKFSDDIDYHHSKQFVKFLEGIKSRAWYIIKNKIINSIDSNTALIECFKQLVKDDSLCFKVRFRSLQLLEKIDVDRFNVIDTLMDLIKQASSKEQFYVLMDFSCRVALADSKVFDYLFEILNNNNCNCEMIIAKTIAKISSREMLCNLISKLKPYWRDKDIYPKQVESHCYLLIHCAQNLSYQEFYEVWEKNYVPIIRSPGESR
jgi:energy-coupling factor transporter ATP-binding protein EcfA2